MHSSHRYVFSGVALTWGMKRAGLPAAFIVCVASCSQAQLGLPRVAAQATSPDGQYLAFVRNHPNPDPPSQSLWLKPTYGAPKLLVELPPDQLWSDEVVWSADSQRVAFVIADAIVYVYEAGDAKRVFSGFVGRPSWDYPPRYILEQVRLSGDGRAIAFIECERVFRPVDAARQNDRGTRREPVVTGCSASPTSVAFADLVQNQPWQ